jgi:hypothetical protein
MERPEIPEYTEEGWKYGDKLYGSNFEAPLRDYARDLDEYCDWLERK